MSKKPLGGGTLFVALGLLFIALIGLRTVSTPELWTHLAQGANNEPISFLASDHGVNTTWLYDKLAYMFWNMGGAPLLIILNIIGLVGAFYMLVRVSSKWGGGLSQGFALLIAGHLMFQTLDVGPQVVMMLCIAAFLFVFSTAKSAAMLFGILVPIQLLWTNMHGSFLYGPILAGLAAAQAAQQNKGAGRKKSQGIQAGTFGILAFALLVSTMVNPSLFKLHGQVLANISSPAPVYWSSLFIEYFQIPALKPLILFTMILGAAGLITLKKRLPIVLTTIAIYGGFLVWTSPHHALLFAVLSFPFIVLSLTAIAEYIHGSLDNLLGQRAKVLPGVTGIVLIALIAVSVFPVITNCAYVRTGSASNFGLGIQEELYPADCEAIFNHPDFPKEKFINTAADGGYLAHKYGLECFIDYRPGRYDKELLQNLDRMMLGNRKAYDELYVQYRPEAIVVNTLSPSAAQGLATLLTLRTPETAKPIWKLAYFDGTTAVLLKNTDKYSNILNNTEIQVAGLAKLEAARAAYAESNGACRAGNPAELIGSGKIYLAFNRPQESKAIFSLLLQGNGKIPGAWIGLGNSQLLLKEFDEAVKSLKVATEQASKNWTAWASYATACKFAGLTEEYEGAVKKAKELAERSKSEEVAKVEQEKLETKKEESLQELTVPE